MIYNPNFKDDLLNYLKDVPFIKNDLKKNEEKITTKIIKHLKEKHRIKVAKGTAEGLLYFAPDIVYDEDKVGVEIKLAKKLLDKKNGNQAIQRLFGQTYYYYNRRKSSYKYFYAGNGLLILVIGELKFESDERIKEIKKVVEKIGASFKYMTVK